MSKYDEINGGFKPLERDEGTEALLRAKALEMERSDGVYASEFQRRPGESDSAHAGRLEHEIAQIKNIVAGERGAK